MIRCAVNAVSRLIVHGFSRPDMTGKQVRKRAEWAVLCGSLFVVPLLLDDDVPLAMKISLQACWAGSIFIGYVLYAEHKKRNR
ncbi:hypothetical protein [Erwinia mallotivora]|uniref:hypothetical protein n=1 Tax=Erwinia mallotivora TaxID=69222 RepID=UPI0021BE9571|nr:hypothetical protein [Erwinia mallotivora]